MDVQDYTTDPTLVTVLNWTAPADVDTDTGLGTYYVGDTVVIARPLWKAEGVEPDEWYIESVGAL